MFLATENMGKDANITSLSMLCLIISRKILLSKNSGGHFESAVLDKQARMSLPNASFRVADTTWPPQNEYLFSIGGFCLSQ